MRFLAYIGLLAAFLVLTGAAGEASEVEWLVGAPGGVAVLLLLEVLRGQAALRAQLAELSQRVFALEHGRPPRPPALVPPAPDQVDRRRARGGGTL